MTEAPLDAYAVAHRGRIEILLVQEGRVVFTSRGLEAVRGRPWEEIERRLRLQGATVRRV